MRIKFKFPRTEEIPQGETSCPRCGGRGVIIHQTLSKRIKDHRLETVQVKRKKCKICQKTFRHYPEGIGRASQTKTLKAISITLYVLGLSYDNVGNFLEALGCGIVKATAWNNLQEAGEEALSLREKLQKEKVRIVGMDTSAFKVAGGKLTVAFLTDLIKGKPIEIEIMESRKARTLKRRFQKLLKDLGAEVKAADDAEEMENLRDVLPGIRRGIPLAHLRKTVALRIREFTGRAEKMKDKADRKEKEILQDLIEDVKSLRELVKKLPEGLEEKLKTLHLQYSFAQPPKKGEKADIFYRMRMLTLRLWQRADELDLYKKVGGDGTNNTTERLIGLCGKIRYKQMRGFKSKESLNRFLKLNAYLQEQNKEIDLAHLL
jgi:transposase-like protein